MVQVSAPISTGSSAQTVTGLRSDAALAMTPDNSRGRWRAIGRVRFEERRRFIRPTALQSPLLASQRHGTRRRPTIGAASRAFQPNSAYSSSRTSDISWKR